MTIVTEFRTQKEAEFAVRAAKKEAWGTGVRVDLKVEKVCGTPASWWLVIAPKWIVGPDMSCAACGMSAHPIGSGCPAR